MVTEDYVSFETAKFLKDKGFDEPVNCFYFVDGTFSNNTFRTKNSYTRHYAAPTLQMAMKWLREVHDINITIDYDNDVDCLEYERWFFTWYANPHYEVDLNTYASYEEACESAIKYCLENLI